MIFVTAEDHEVPSTVILGEDDEDDEMEGLIKANGEINWDCPCLQGMAYGPCGQEFKAAFSCFHYSEEDPKGSDCIPQFRGMQECFVKYPEIYGKDDDVSLDDDEESKNEAEIFKASGDERENNESLEQTDSSPNHSKDVSVQPSTQSSSNSNSASS